MQKMSPLSSDRLLQYGPTVLILVLLGSIYIYAGSKSSTPLHIRELEVEFAKVPQLPATEIQECHGASKFHPPKTSWLTGSSYSCNYVTARACGDVKALYERNMKLAGWELDAQHTDLATGEMWLIKGKLAGNLFCKFGQNGFRFGLHHKW